jgi:hypothetical protein
LLSFKLKFLGASKKLPAQQSGINLQLKAIEKKQIHLKPQRLTPPSPPLGIHKGREQRTTPSSVFPLKKGEKLRHKKRGRSLFHVDLKKI